MSIAVIGAGPAGIRAVETLLAHGLRPVWIDEASRSGGQIYRRPPVNFRRSPETLYGFEAAKARRLHAAADAAAQQADYRPSTLVWDIAEGKLQTAGPDGLDNVPFEAMILATGAMDRIIPLPGWTLPGAFSLGGAQVALKAQGVAIGRRCVFFGTGPLLYLVAYQYAKAGTQVAAVLDTAPASAKHRAMPRLLAGAGTLAKGLYYIAWLKAHGIAMAGGIEPLEILGPSQARGLRFRNSTGSECEIAADAVALGFGLRSETQLADLAGCRFRFDPLNRQWLPETDDDGRALGLGNLYLAGDGAGIAGADAAELAGERAALALLADRGIAGSAARRQWITRRLARMKEFRRGLEQAFPFPDRLARRIADGTILCRCEAVTAGELRASVAGIGATELNRAKAYSRVGMGRCQGRICGAAAAEILAAALGSEIATVGRLRSQPPVKPLPAGLL
jgi:NADPH-dependent 2,4-dienoyl-CoA reductase/sulfur reductase-like enzyme